MKLLSVFAAALASTAAAAPTAPISSGAEHNLLAPRAGFCWANSINAATTATSPLVTDCQTLSQSNLAGPWTPSEDNNYSFDLQSGTCGFKGVFNPNSGSMAASDVAIGPALVSLAIDHAIEYMAVDGKVAANGAFGCMIAGPQTKTGWTNWEIYTVE
ncbi:hypothetical protein MFIFM68171_08149 [Madurella fahalii]|uniref:Ecp2 effector protein-like domain-containing protein n=1 Tax=Madurella fahalii TaxID=1157608 RepID=A0ABQ0GJR7_9PEZI